MSVEIWQALEVRESSSSYVLHQKFGVPVVPFYGHLWVLDIFMGYLSKHSKRSKNNNKVEIHLHNRIEKNRGTYFSASELPK